MKKYANLFRIAYHGSKFHGSQIQPNVVTVEGVIKKILIELGATSPFFASRTDKGVNATCNIITTTSNKTCKDYIGDLIEKLDAYPIWVTGFTDVELSFNPRIAVERKYKYYLFNEKNKDLFNKAIQLFVGKHDFKNFARILEKDSVDTRRKINSIDIISKGNILICEIKGISFLWHQVRKMIGAATDVTHGRREIIDIKKALNGEKIEFTMAKAEFLTLNNIEYENIVIEKVKNERNMRKKYELSRSDNFFWEELL